MININVLDKKFNIVGIIDTYESFIWTDRFKDSGDFELYSGVDSNILNLCKQDYYIQIKESPHLMIIEGIEISTDSEAGNHIRVYGRSLESILDRRIIWDQTTVSGGKDHTLKTAIEVLFKLCFGVNGAKSGTVLLSNGKTQKITVREERVVPNIIYLKPSDDVLTYIDEKTGNTKDVTIDKTQFTGDNLYDIMIDIMDSYSSYGLGYRILPLYSMRNLYSDSYMIDRSGISSEDFSKLSEYTLVFELYTGVDRSYANKGVRPYVIFSPDYDNIINTNYHDDTTLYKNVTLVLGEGEGTKRKRLIVGGKDTNGDYFPPFERRELYTDARDLQSSEYGSSANYQLALKQRGLEKLYECTKDVTFEGEVEAERTFVYMEDFIMGDIVSITNEFGISGNARVIEYIINDTSSGRSFYPTFDAVEIISDDIEEDDVDEVSTVVWTKSELSAISKSQIDSIVNS